MTAVTGVPPAIDWTLICSSCGLVDEARIRARVEHPFHIIKNRFGLRKVRYRGLAKNTKQLFTLFGLANLVLARRWLLAPDSRIAS